MAKRYWLMKSEPDVFSIDDLARVGVEKWDGVRNYQARNFMRDDMQPEDAVLFYHSNAKPPGVAGLAKVVSSPYPDPSQFNRDSKYYDPKSSPQNPRWILVDVGFVERFAEVLPLEVLKQTPELGEMLVVQRGMRLSVQPVTKREFEVVCRLGRRRGAPPQRRTGGKKSIAGGAIKR